MKMKQARKIDRLTRSSPAVMRLLADVQAHRAAGLSDKDAIAAAIGAGNYSAEDIAQVSHAARRVRKIGGVR